MGASEAGRYPHSVRATIRLTTHRRGLHDVTERIRAIVRSSGIRDGICVAYLKHTSASLIVQENHEPSARQDLEAFFDRFAPDGDPRFTHVTEGPDDMASHIRAAVTRTSETFLVESGDLVIGKWQGIFLFEHRTAPHERVIELRIVKDD